MLETTELADTSAAECGAPHPSMGFKEKTTLSWYFIQSLEFLRYAYGETAGALLLIVSTFRSLFTPHPPTTPPLKGKPIQSLIG